MTPAKRTRFWQRPGVLIPAALILLVTLGIMGLRFSSKSGIKAELAAVRARGLPVSPQELDAWYQHVPDDENRALAILKAAEMFLDPPRGKDPNLYGRRDLPLGAPIDPDILAAIENYVAMNAEPLAQMHAAAALPKSRYPIDFTKIPDISFRSLAPVKRTSQILRWEAIALAEKGDSKGTLRSMTTGFALNSSLSEEPMLISALVRIAVLAIHLGAAEQALSRTHFDTDALAALERASRDAEADGRRAIHRAMVGERVFGLASFKTINAQNFSDAMAWGMPPWLEKIPEPLQPLVFTLRRSLGMHDADLAFYIDTMGKLDKATELDFPSMLGETTNLFTTVEAELDARPIRLMMSRFVLPALARVPEKEVRLASQLRCLVAAIQVERFRLHNDKLPSPAEIKPPAFPDWPRDAADDQPLRFELLEPKGFRVVALRSSELANQGRAPSSTNWQDVAFTLMR